MVGAAISDSSHASFHSSMRSSSSGDKSNFRVVSNHSATSPSSRRMRSTTSVALFSTCWNASKILPSSRRSSDFLVVASAMPTHFTWTRIVRIKGTNKRSACGGSFVSYGSRKASATERNRAITSRSSQTGVFVASAKSSKLLLCKNDDDICFLLLKLSAFFRDCDLTQSAFFNEADLKLSVRHSLGDRLMLLSSGSDATDSAPTICNSDTTVPQSSMMSLSWSVNDEDGAVGSSFKLGTSFSFSWQSLHSSAPAASSS
mmetsp:Transcript_7854/g.23152  ORF Transcript_7854/g.23152 Transcript_7854/m.23152 type:complete len:259 (-) Transcript_7854:1266-2042(-)